LSAEARPTRWNPATIALHWAGAAVILALIGVGWAMRYGGLNAARTFDLYQQHKSLGFAALAVTAARLAGRALAPAPASTGAMWERPLATSVQALTYLLTVLAIASGWMVVSTAPLPVPTRIFGLIVVPDIAAPNPALFAAARLAHQLAAWSILGLVALHVLGALKHHFLDRDEALTRMLPRWPKPSRGG
jgi:cytochrome b561